MACFFVPVDGAESQVASRSGGKNLTAGRRLISVAARLRGVYGVVTVVVAG